MNFNLRNRSNVSEKSLLFLLLTGMFTFSTHAAQENDSQTTKTSSSASQPLNLKLPPKSGLDLNDLGFSPSDAQGSSEKQNLLNERSKKLQVHQILGLVTLGLMTGAYFSADEGHSAPMAHQLFAYSSVASYAATAYYSLSAPGGKGFSAAGWNMKIHRALVFVHLPGMLLTPIAGYLANRSYKNDEMPSGLGQYKSALANITYFAFAASALSVTIDF